MMRPLKLFPNLDISAWSLSPPAACVASHLEESNAGRTYLVPHNLWYLLDSLASKCSLAFEGKAGSLGL